MTSDSSKLVILPPIIAPFPRFEIIRIDSEIADRPLGGPHPVSDAAAFEGLDRPNRKLP